MMSPPLLGPQECFGNAAAWLGSRGPGLREDRLCLQAAVLTQVKKNQCVTRTTQRASRLFREMHSQSPALLYSVPQWVTHSLPAHDWHLQRQPAPRVTGFTRPSEGARASLVLAKARTPTNQPLEPFQVKSGSGRLIGQPVTSAGVSAWDEHLWKRMGHFVL